MTTSTSRRPRPVRRAIARHACAAPLVAVAAPSIAVPALPPAARGGQPRPDPGLGLELGGERGQPVGRRRAVQRAAGGLHPERVGPGPPGLRQHDDRLRGHATSATRASTRSTGVSDTSHGRAVRLPADRRRAAPSFPYQIKVDGQLVANLRLSGRDAGQDLHQPDHQLGRPGDHQGQQRRKLPSLPIIPVVHSEGSGSTAQLTRYFATQYPSIWRPFAGSDRA